MGINFLLIHTRKRLEEALPEVLAEEGIQYGIHRRIGIDQGAQQQENEYLEAGQVPLSRVRVDERQLGHPMGQPAADIDRNDGQDQPGDLSMGPPLLLRLGGVFGAHRL